LEEFDIERFAHQMILEHGAHARSEAAKWAAKMLERRDFEAYRFWEEAWAAIEVVESSTER
jgi:hypothetical protein